MAHSKANKTLKQSFQDQAKRIYEDHPVIDTRWYVVEVIPSKEYSGDDGHGRSETFWTDKKILRVSPYYKTKKSAKEWKKKMDPEEGNSLQVHKQELRASYRWWNGHRDD